MPQDSQPAAVPAPDISLSPPPIPPGLLELFIAFAKMSLAGFGGVLVWARRGIVDQHRWMTAEEFNDTFALCHSCRVRTSLIYPSYLARVFAASPAVLRPLPGWSARRR